MPPLGKGTLGTWRFHQCSAVPDTEPEHSDLAAPVLLRRDRFLSLHIRSKHRVHTGKVSLPLCLEPIDDIAVEAKVNGSFPAGHNRSEEHTSELQSLRHLVCRLL